MSFADKLRALAAEYANEQHPGWEWAYVTVSVYFPDREFHQVIDAVSAQNPQPDGTLPLPGLDCRGRRYRSRRRNGRWRHTEKSG